MLGVLPDLWPECLSAPLVPASELLLLRSSVPFSGACSEDLGLEACLVCCVFRRRRALFASDTRMGPLLKGLGPEADSVVLSVLHGLLSEA